MFRITHTVVVYWTVNNDTLKMLKCESQNLNMCNYLLIYIVGSQFFLIFYTNLSVLNLMINKMFLCALHHENFNNFLFWYMYIISNNKMAMHMIVWVVKALYLTLATIITFRPFNYLIYICLVHQLFSWFSSRAECLLRFYTHTDTVQIILLNDIYLSF